MIGTANTLNSVWLVYKNWNLQITFNFQMIRSMYIHGLSVLLWQNVNEGEVDES